MPHKKSYSKLFLLPKFLEMPAVSVEILPNGVNYLLLKNTEKGLVPDIYGFIPLPEGTILQGEIVRKDPLLKVLVEIRNKTKASFVRFSIPESKTYIFKTHLPALAEKEIRGILDFKIEENIPLSGKEAVFDYDIIPDSNLKNGVDVVVSATSASFVAEMQAIFEAINLTPVYFGPESNNVARSVIKKGNEQIIVIVNIRDQSIVLSLVIYGVVCQTSSLGFGGSTFNDLLAKYFKVSLTEAEKMKREKLYQDNPDNMEIFSYLINTISAIKDEIYKFISYCNEREDVIGRVDRIILCGRDARIVGLDKYLSLNLDLEVSLANVWVNNFELDDYVPNISQADSLDLTVVNGLSLN